MSQPERINGVCQECHSSPCGHDLNRREAISRDYTLYIECQQIAEEGTRPFGPFATAEHVRVLWGMLEAAKEELAAAQERMSPLGGDPYD